MTCACSSDVLYQRGCVSAKGKQCPEIRCTQLIELIKHELQFFLLTRNLNDDPEKMKTDLEKHLLYLIGKKSIETVTISGTISV